MSSENPANLDETIDEAMTAFWQALADRIPVESGDLDPGSTIEFERACRQVAETWSTWNASVDGGIVATCGTCNEPMRWAIAPTGGWWKHETHPDDNHDASFPALDPR